MLASKPVNSCPSEPEISRPVHLAAMKRHAEVLNPLEIPGWDDLVMTHPDYTFFHGSAWARVLHETYGYTPFYFTVREEDCLLALMPVMEVDSWLTGRRGVALPFTDDCEALVSERVEGRALLEQTLQFGRSQRWKYFECKGGKRLVPEACASLNYYRHTLALTGDEQALFDRFEPSVRRAVRKAQKEGVTTEVAYSFESIKTFYRLHCRTRQVHGQPPQPFAFFEHIHKHIIANRMGLVVLARHANRPVAGGIYFLMGRRAIYKFGASDPAGAELRGNNAVMWEAIRSFSSRGVESLCFGRTSLHDEGLRRYKLGWGTIEHLTAHLRYDLRKEQFREQRDQSHGWHTRLFRFLPMPVFRLVGRLLYRHVA